MDASTFKFLKPTPGQIEDMEAVRKAAAQYAQVLELLVPAGADKSYLLRKLREITMWANVAITRHENGTPRGPNGIA